MLLAIPEICKRSGTDTLSRGIVILTVTRDPNVCITRYVQYTVKHEQSMQMYGHQPMVVPASDCAASAIKVFSAGCSPITYCMKLMTPALKHLVWNCCHKALKIQPKAPTAGSFSMGNAHAQDNNDMNVRTRNCTCNGFKRDAAGKQIQPSKRLSMRPSSASPPVQPSKRLSWRTPGLTHNRHRHNAAGKQIQPSKRLSMRPSSGNPPVQPSKRLSGQIPGSEVRLSKPSV